MNSHDMRHPHRASTVSMLSVLLLSVLLLVGSGCGGGSPTPTVTTGRQPTSVPSASTSMTTTGQTSATVPSTEPTTVATTPATTTAGPLPTTAYVHPSTTAAPSVLLERWPAESSIPALYIPKHADPSSAKPLTGMTVILDAGHGGSDPGAVAADGTLEKSINLPIALKTRALLESMGANVIMHRTEDVYLSIYNRVARTGLYILNRAAGLAGFAGQFNLSDYQADFNAVIAANTGDWDGAMEGRGLHLGFGVREEVRRLLDLERQFTDTIIVSIHSNSASPDTAARGLQVYYGPTEYIYADEVYEIGQDRDVYHWGYPVYNAYTGYDDVARAGLASSIFNKVAGNVPELQAGANAGVRPGNYGILRENNFAAVLVECGFMSNPDDLAILTDTAGQDAIARGVADGILEYFTNRG